MIEIKDVAFGYGGRDLFSGLKLTLRSGQIYGLLGKNAQGKTTLLKLIAGLRFPREGSINVFGMNAGDREPELLQKIFFVPEQIELPSLRVGDYAAELSDYYSTFRLDSFAGYIEEFEIYESVLMQTLSFGEQKKVLLALALSSGCPLILLDEPMNGLDVPAKMKFRRLLAMAATEDSTFILSTHQIRELEQLIDPVIILHNGGVLLNESLSRIGEHLEFGMQAEKPSASEVVYSELGPGGYSVIRQSGMACGNPVDMELLFSAAVNDPDLIRAIFGRKGGV